MSGSRWVITPSWLSGPWRYFWSQMPSDSDMYKVWQHWCKLIRMSNYINIYVCVCVCVCVWVSRVQLCNPMHSSQAPFPWNSPGKNTGVGCYSLFQGISPTQGSNLSLLHCRQILHHLSQQGSPNNIYSQWLCYTQTIDLVCIYLLLNMGSYLLRRKSQISSPFSFSALIHIWSRK